MDDVFKLGVVLSLQDYLSGGISEVKNRWDSLKKSFGESTTAFDKAESSLKNLGKATAMIGAGIVIAKPLGAAVDAARSFEKELSVLKATSGATASEMKMLHDAAIDAGAMTQFSPDQAAQGLTALASAGIAGADNIKNALLPALDLAAASAGKLGIDQAAADMAATMMSFAKQGATATQVADTFVNMANIASFSIQDLGPAWRGVNLAASSANQSLATTGAVMAALKNSGATAIESGEGVRMALTALKAPSKQAADELTKLGVSAYGQDGQFRNLIDIFADLEKATAKMAESDRNAVLQKILHEGGIKAFQATVGQGISKVREWEKSNQNSAGAAKRFAETVQGSYEGASVKLQGMIDTFKVMFGEALLPGLTMVKNAIMAILDPMLVFLKNNAWAAGAFSWTLVAFSGLLILVGTYKALAAIKGLYNSLLALSKIHTVAQAAANTWLGTTMNMLSVSTLRSTAAVKAQELARKINIATMGIERTATTLSTVLYGVLTGKIGIATAAQWAWNAAMTANPIGLVIVAIAALVGAIVALVYYWDTVRGAMESVWNWAMQLDTHWKILGGTILLVLGPIGLLIGGIVAIVANLDYLIGTVKEAWSWLKRLFGFEDVESSSDKINSQIGKVDERIQGLQKERAKKESLFGKGSKEVLEIDAQLNAASINKDYLSKKAQGLEQYDSKVKDITTNEKRVQEEINAIKSKKTYSSDEILPLQNRLEQLNEEKQGLKKDEFVNEALKVKPEQKGIEEAKDNLGEIPKGLEGQFKDSVKGINNEIGKIPTASDISKKGKKGVKETQDSIKDYSTLNSSELGAFNDNLFNSINKMKLPSEMVFKPKNNIKPVFPIEDPNKFVVKSEVVSKAVKKMESGGNGLTPPQPSPMGRELGSGKTITVNFNNLIGQFVKNGNGKTDYNGLGQMLAQAIHSAVENYEVA